MSMTRICHQRPGRVHLAARSETERLGLLREWIAQATATFGALPEPAVGGESSTFLNSWARVLA